MNIRIPYKITISIFRILEDGLNDVAEDDHEIERQMDDYDDGVARGNHL